MTESQDRKSQDPLQDPVVEEIRQIRRQLWEESGHDIRRYIARVREEAAKARKDMIPPDRARRTA